jgi:hypothetical protein
MRVFQIAAVSILLVGGAGLAGQKPRSDSTSSLEGLVISDASGDPIEGARVSLLKDPGVITGSGQDRGANCRPNWMGVTCLPLFLAMRTAALR